MNTHAHMPTRARPESKAPPPSALGAPAAPRRMTATEQSQRILRSFVAAVEARWRALGWTQKEAMRRGGFSQQGLDKWRAGSLPNLETICKVAHGLECEVVLEMVPVSEGSGMLSASGGPQEAEHLSPDTQRLLDICERLDDGDRQNLLGYARGLEAKASPRARDD